jgi:hypothetical protein
MYWIIAWGPGISQDSIVYLKTAQSLVSGEGFYESNKPLTHFPPTYPLLIAAAGFFQKGNLLQATRLLSAFFTGANIILLALAIQICTKNNLPAVCSTLFFFLSSATIFSVHAMAWSEPAFIAFTLSTLILLSFHMISGKLYLLLVASFMASLALTTRYIGVTLLPTIAVAVLIFGDGSLRNKIKKISSAVTTASLPLTIFLFRNIFVAESATNRSMSVHPFGIGNLKQGITTIIYFTLPLTLSPITKVFLFSIIVILLLISFFFLIKNRSIIFREKSFLIVFYSINVIFILNYLFFIIISISFFDAKIPLDGRMLVPALVSLFCIFLLKSWIIADIANNKRVWYFFMAFLWLSIFINITVTIGNAVDVHHNGIGFNSKNWKNSPIWPYLSNLDNKVIYSNGEDLIWFFTGHKAVRVPEKIDPITHLPNRNYEKQLNQIAQSVLSDQAIVVYLPKVNWRWYLPSLEELEFKANLPILQKFEDSVVFGNPLQVK